MTSPLGSLEIGPREGRRVTVARTTRETDITVTLGLDGAGHATIDTGIGFYDHLLGSFAHHGLFDLSVKAAGDRHVDDHHTIEDVGICLGQAIAEGETLQAITARTRQVAEGVLTTRSIRDMARRMGVEMPITAEVFRVLFEDKDPRRAVIDLMTRRGKSEEE